MEFYINRVGGRKKLGGSSGGQRGTAGGSEHGHVDSEAEPTAAASQLSLATPPGPAWACSHTESPHVWKATGKFTGRDRAAALEAKYRKRVKQPSQPHPAVHKTVFHKTHLRRLQWERSPRCPPGSQLSHQGNNPRPPQPPGSWPETFPGISSPGKPNLNIRRVLWLFPQGLQASLPAVFSLHFSSSDRSFVTVAGFMQLPSKFQLNILFQLTESLSRKQKPNKSQSGDPGYVTGTAHIHTSHGVRQWVINQAAR